MWYCPTEGTYIVIETKVAHIVCPSEDIRPHRLKDTRCLCKPEIFMCDDGFTHVVHSRFSEKDAVEKSLQKIFGK